MSLQISFLGSGSGGNCTLVEYNEFRFLIDAGMGIRYTLAALGRFGLEMADISLVLLTHTHGDHVKDPVLKRMASCGTPLVCRDEHCSDLEDFKGFYRLNEKDLIRYYGEESFELRSGITLQPVKLMHDAEPTYGFIFDFRLGHSDLRFAYIADCGRPTAELIEHLQGVEHLALEFNHDETMEKQSSRPSYLIDRVLGPYGHLSNETAAAVAGSVASAGMKSLTQLHISEECNRPEVAMSAARKVLNGKCVYQTCRRNIRPVLKIN